MLNLRRTLLLGAQRAGARRFATPPAAGGKPAAGGSAGAAAKKPMSKIPPKAEKSGGGGMGGLVGLVVVGGIGYNAYAIQQMKGDAQKTAEFEANSPQVASLARKVGLLPPAAAATAAAAAHMAHVAHAASAASAAGAAGAAARRRCACWTRARRPAARVVPCCTTRHTPR